MRTRRLALPAPFLLLVLMTANLSAARDPHVAETAPPDRPQRVAGEQYRDFIAACEPYVKKARESYPAAKARYLAGLPPKHSFFITARLIDDAGRMEQVFVAVDRIADGVIEGQIWSSVDLVTGYKFRDTIRVPEAEIVDWLITNPDGTEEGNVVGNFLDHYEPGKAP